MEYLDLSRMREVGYTSTKLLSVHVRIFCQSMWETRSESEVGIVFKRATHGIRCSSTGAGVYQPALHYCGRRIACIRRKASCTEPRGPYSDSSVRIHVPCNP